MDPVEREQRVKALTAELDHLAAELAETAGNVIDAAGDTDELLDAAEIVIATGLRFHAAYRSILAIRLKPPRVGFEMSST